MSDRYLGKFAGVVVDNDDPDGLCRIDVIGPVRARRVDRLVPAGAALRQPHGAGLAVVPPVGASVWVEWPDGDLAKPPIWSGAWFTAGNGVPGAGPNTILLVTPGGHKIEVSDDSNAITLTASGGASITIGPDGITLDNGQGAKIELASATVSINGQSLQVS